MRRGIVLFLFASLVLWVTFARSPVPTVRDGHRLPITVIGLALPDRALRARHLGPFTLEAAWQFKSRNASVFGYSALVAQPDGTLTAFNDASDILAFTPPDRSGPPPRVGWIRFKGDRHTKDARDVESATRDPATGQYWVGLESRNSIARLSPGFAATGEVKPRAMAGWGINSGAEAMARLTDGRFVTIREVPTSWSEKRLHEALLFAGDPIRHPRPRRFQFDGPDDFSVVDMTVLPDGRALILMRRLLWPLPMRFAGRIVIADTARITAGQVWHSTPLASLDPSLKVDNFEAIAAVPRRDGRLTVWLMSDDNAMRVLQRTLLWKLSVDPARLPWPR